MSKDCNDCNYLHGEYVVKGRSTKSIAQEHNTFPNTVRRALKKCGLEIRNKSVAQKRFIETNGGSPILGRKRTKAEKEAIAAGLHDFWNTVGEEEKLALKTKMAECARNHWAGLTDNEKKDAIYRMHLASKNKTYEGSRNENMVASMLSGEGYRIEQRATANVPGHQFEIDIGIPEMRIAIEWDGATHFLPIYGEEHLAKVVAKDSNKNNLLMNAGWHIIRCRDYSTSPTKAFCKRALTQINEAITKLTFEKKPQLVILDIQ